MVPCSAAELLVFLFKIISYVIQGVPRNKTVAKLIEIPLVLAFQKCGLPFCAVNISRTGDMKNFTVSGNMTAKKKTDHIWKCQNWLLFPES